MTRHPILLALLLGAALPASAETLVCPDPAAAVQVATCPSEDELKYTFTGYCSDNARLYDRDTEICASYQSYRKAKNTALWESKDGAFQAYVSCDLPAGALKQLKPASIAVTRQGKLNRVACSYGDNVTFTYRSKAQCRVEGDGRCAADPAACKASCD